MRILEIIKSNYFLLISTFLFIYILFNLLDGERGLLSYFEKKNFYNNQVEKKSSLISNLSGIENKIILLTDKIDLDYLEILYREKFFYGKSNEKVFINQNDN